MPAEPAESRTPLRLLHVHSGNRMGGVESVLLTMAEFAHTGPGLHQEFSLVFDGQLADSLREAGAQVHVLPQTQLRNPISVIRSRRALTRLLRTRKYDAVVLHSTWGQVVFAPAIRHYGMPLIFWMHDRFDGHWLQYLAARNRPDFAICNSLFTQSSLANVYPNVASEVVYCPVRPHPEVVDRGELRRNLGADSDTVVILMATRTDAWKGHLNLLMAASQIQSETKWVIWISGAPQTSAENTYFESVQAEVKRLQLNGRVHFLGQRSDVPAVMRAADIYCQPNAEPEPFGVVLVEALQAGAPIITFSMGGPQEILDAGSGILVPPGDIAGLAAALKRLIEDAWLRTQLGLSGPARAKALCDPEQQLGRVHKILSSIGIAELKH